MPDERPRRMPADWQNTSEFGGPATFNRVPITRDLSEVDVALIGVPLDLGTTLRPGARYGPQAIRDGSRGMDAHGRTPEGLREPYRSLRVVDYGDIELPAGYIDEAVRRIEAAVADVVAAGAFPLCLGGDHTISLPIMRALAKKHGKLSLVHFDAHPDFWGYNTERPLNHGTQFRMASDEGIIDPHRSVQIGIRGSSSLAILDEVRAAGITSLTDDDFTAMGVQKTILTIHKAVAGGPVYISLDIDSVDPAFAPGTGVPEIAGLTSREIVALVRGLKGIGAVGFDIVEVAPAYDPSEITGILAANLVYEFLLTLVP